MNGPKPMHPSGVSLTELMIAVAVIGIGIISGVKAFQSIQESVQGSKARTLATNLAQEKIQILKQQSYNRLIVSTSTAFYTQLDPDVPYDPYYYVPETILEGGTQYTRMTYVQVAQEDSGNLTTLAPTTLDTGMKLVTVTVAWNLRNAYHQVQVRAIDSNPNTVMSNSILSGLVRSTATSSPIQNAVVNIAENVGWRDTTSANGSYTINLSSGSFNAVATADGYFSQFYSFSVGGNQTVSKIFYLFPISTGTLRGTVWVNDHPVISQVVHSTTTDRDYEYIELYNPTTSYISMATSAFHICKQNSSCNFSSVEPIVNTASWAPQSYYLIANYNDTVTAGGVTRTVDAYYPSIGSHWLLSGEAGSLRLHFSPYSSNPMDVIGYKNGASDIACSGYFEGQTVAATGLAVGEQLIRRTSTSTIDANFASTYDTNNNSLDIVDILPMTVAPRNSLIISTPVAGMPAYGAIVSVSDGLSAATTAYAAGASGNPPYAEFLVPGVATGTWNIYVTSSSRYQEIGNVLLTANTTAWVPNAGTSPVWPGSGYYSMVLSTDATTGFIMGRITNVANGVISGITASVPGYAPVAVNGSGRYTMSVAPGVYTVSANPGNSNGSYVSQDVTGVTVTVGTVNSGIDFVLSQGGRLSGFITRDGINPLSGIVVTAYNSNNIVADQAVSGSNGTFTLVNLTTGAYTVQPILDAGEASTPISTSVNVSSGNTVAVGTFTITGAYGSITGTVTTGGTPIKKGVLIVVSTTTVTSPPALSSATLTGTGYYANSSLEDGTYRVEVRGSSTTTYNVHGFYTTLNGQVPSTSTDVVTGVTVAAGATTSGVNLEW